MVKKTPAIFITESRGGTFTLPHSNANVIHIGTSNCISCVGIYLSISSTRCFVAHINAFVKVPVMSIAGWRRSTVELRPSEGVQIQEEVVRRLNEVAERDGWDKEDVLRYLQEGGKKAVVVCPGLGDLQLKDRPGSWVIRGIEQFLGGEVDLMGSCKQEAQGFVVNHQSGEVSLVGNDGEGAEEERAEFERVDVELEDDGWKVGVSREGERFL